MKNESGGASFIVGLPLVTVLSSQGAINKNPPRRTRALVRTDTLDIHDGHIQGGSNLPTLVVRQDLDVLVSIAP